MNDDATLLLRYAREGSGAAFAELVRRHIDLVYSAALRRCNGDTHKAGDAVQQVFTALAHNAEKLASHPTLDAWLYTATRNAVINLALAEQRRALREQEAAMSGMLSPRDAEPDWGELRPVLDDVMDELSEPDRTAVLLRFFKKHSFSEIGASLNVSENTARMRTERALEKLRALLAKRGVHSSVAALGLVLGRQAVVAAPAALAVAVTATIWGIPEGSVVTLGTAAGQSATKMLVTAGALVVAAVLVTVGVVRLRQPRTPAPVTEVVASAVVPVLMSPDEKVGSKQAGASPLRSTDAPLRANTGGNSGLIAAGQSAASSDPKAVDVMQKMAAAYAALTSYQDSGEVVVKNLKGVERERISFETNFRRPDDFFLRWNIRIGSRSSTNGYLWWFDDKAGDYRSYDSRGGVAGSRSKTLITGNIVTAGGSFHVPRFFVGKDGESFFSLIDLVGVSWAGEMPHEDGLCHVIKGQHANGTPFELWIGQKDFLLRKLRSVFPIPVGKNDGQTEAPEALLEETHRNVRINAVLPNEVFREAKLRAAQIAK